MIQASLQRHTCYYICHISLVHHHRSLPGSEVVSLTWHPAAAPWRPVCFGSRRGRPRLRVWVWRGTVRVESVAWRRRLRRGPRRTGSGWSEPEWSCSSTAVAAAAAVRPCGYRVRMRLQERRPHREKNPRVGAGRRPPNPAMPKPARAAHTPDTRAALIPSLAAAVAVLRHAVASAQQKSTLAEAASCPAGAVESCLPP